MLLMLCRFTEWVCASAEIQFRLAIEFIKSAITIDDTDENFFLDLVLAYKLDNQLTESLRVYRIATDIAPNLETSWIEFIVF